MKLLNKIITILQFRNIRIRSRILTAGIGLGVVAFFAPFIISSQTTQLGRHYDEKNTIWELVVKSEVLMKRINRVEAYLEPIEKQDLDEMEEIVLNLQRNITSDDKAVIEEFTSHFNAWKARALESPTQERRNIVIQMQHKAETLEKILLERNETSKKGLGARIRLIRKVAIISGVTFFTGFLLFLFSVWFTIMPDLGALIRATNEFKQGNLDYRAEISGKSETAELGVAFNEMAIELKDQTEKLRDMNKIKTDFVSTVSHELRTPLTAIKGSIRLILGGVTGELQSKEMRSMLEITAKNTDRLIRLINDVLDIAKIEAGKIKLRFDKYSLDEVIAHAIEGISPFARTREINLIYDRPKSLPLVVLDRDRIEQVVTNLISNGIKFTEAGGYVRVSVECLSDRVSILVEDNGRGIPAEFMGRLFEKFQQAESSSHKNSIGTGLGLAIVKGLVEEHGGEVSVESQVGQGTRFHFTIPWNGVDFVENEGSLESSETYKKAA